MLSPDPLPQLSGVVLRETVHLPVGEVVFRKADYPWLTFAVLTLRCGRSGVGDDGTAWPGDYKRLVRRWEDIPSTWMLWLEPGLPGPGGLESDGRPAECHIDLYGPRP